MAIEDKLVGINTTDEIIKSEASLQGSAMAHHDSMLYLHFGLSDDFDASSVTENFVRYAAVLRVPFRA